VKSGPVQKQATNRVLGIKQTKKMLDCKSRSNDRTKADASIARGLADNL
jgi:hypothetical protein